MPLAAAAALLAAAASAQTVAPARPASAPPAQREAERDLPLEVQADEIRGRPDLETVAEGRVEAKRGSLVLRADRLSYEAGDDLVRAKGGVRIERDGDLFAGSELQLQLQRFEGFMLQPEYFFARTGAGGRAQRIDFLDRQRSQAIAATYTSCPNDGSGAPAWVLSANRVKMDFAANEGVAEGAVLRFYGVPLLAAPVLSFPLSDERKSGWLPPGLNIDSRSGFDVAVPYYWNIAPNRDATFTPGFLSRRGVSLETEFRYLEPADRGEIRLNLLPRDRLADRSREALHFLHEGDRFGQHYAARVLRVSDDAYWKDFPRAVPSITPRLLPLDLQTDRRFTLGGEWTAYARVQHWQVLQDRADAASRIAAPYQRSPQLGVRGEGGLPFGLAYSLESEFNRFTLPDAEERTRPIGARWHALGMLSRPWIAPGWWVVPRLTLNAASYAIEAPAAPRRNASRVIPTASVDAGMLFERGAGWFGRSLRQTLEPRLLYVNTPFRDQADLPLFDTAGKDFNETSVFSENAFSGVDRVSDAHQLTAGVTTRLLDPASGAELMRLGVAQRVLFRDQRITPDGTPLTQRFSDILLLGASRLSASWSVDAALQYQPDTNRVMRSLSSVRWSPGPFRTVSMGYRQSRDLSKQLDVGWQWPVYGPRAGDRAAQGGACKGTLYSVGRTSYSLRESRITDALVGLEYDAGCWIGRVVAERLSTGRTEATTRLMIQLELVGLSRLGSNPLKVLKDNIPGYRLLREERGATPSAPPVYE